MAQGWLTTGHGESTRPPIFTLYFCVRDIDDHKMAGNMKNLLDKARGVANKRRTEGSTTDSPIKVKRVQHNSLVHFLPEQGMQLAMVFKRDIREFSHTLDSTMCHYA